MAISASKWRQRYAEEVERQIAYAEEMNKHIPTIKRKITPEEKEMWSKPKTNRWSLANICPLSDKDKITECKERTE